VSDPDLRVVIGDLELANPVLAASGTFGYGLELADLCPPEILGGIVTKGLSPAPRAGAAQQIGGIGFPQGSPSR